MLRKKTFKFISMRKKATDIKSGFRAFLVSHFLFFTLHISSTQLISYHSSLLNQKKNERNHLRTYNIPSIGLEVIICPAQYQHKHAIIPQHP